MTDDLIRLSEFKKALRKDAQGGIVDLDKNYLHKFNFQIHRYEDVLQNSRRESPPNRWSFHRIGLITRGSGEIMTGIYNYRASKNTLAVIPSRVITSSRNWSDDAAGYILLFNTEFLTQNTLTRPDMVNRRILSPAIQPYIYLSDEQSAEFIPIFEKILQEKKFLNDGYSELIAVKILELLILLERLRFLVKGEVISSCYHETIARFDQLLEKHFAEKHSVGFYAEQLSMHPNYLNLLVKRHAGISAKEAITNKILQETKYLLHATELSVKEISNQLGFKDQNYFTTFFKRSEKISPLKYRAAQI